MRKCHMDADEARGMMQYGSPQNAAPKPVYSVGYKVSDPLRGMGEVIEVRETDASFEYLVQFSSCDSWVPQGRMS